MGDSRIVIRALGLLILAVVAIGGGGTVIVLARVSTPDQELAYLVGPWAAIAVVGMALMWAGSAVIVFARTRSTRTHLSR